MKVKDRTDEQLVNEMMSLRQRISEMESTERQRRWTEEALCEIQEQFRHAFEHAVIGLGLVAPDGGWLRVNHSLCEIAGYSEEELLASTLQAIVHLEDLPVNIDFMRRMLEGKLNSYHMEMRFFHKHGHPVWVFASTSLVQDAWGKPLYFILQVQDITQRKLAEIALNATKEVPRALMNTSVGAVALTDTKGTVLASNETFAKKYHKRINEVLGTCICDFLPPDIAEKRKAQIAEVMHSGKPIRIKDENEGKARDTTIYPILDVKGKVFKFIMFSRDVVGRNNVEHDLRADERRHAAVAEIGRRVISQRNPGELMVDAGGLAADTLQAEASGIFELIPGDSMLLLKSIYTRFIDCPEGLRVNETEFSMHNSLMGYAINTGQPVVTSNTSSETRFSTIYLQNHGIKCAAAIPIKFHNRTYGTLGVFSTRYREFTEQDIHFCEAVANILAVAIERNRAEDLCMKAEEDNRLLSEEIEYDKLKTEFFWNISHEFKTPLNVIFSTLQLLNLQLEDSVQNNFKNPNKYINIMRQNCYRLLRLVNNMIDISKIDSNSLDMHLQNHNIVGIIKEIVLTVYDYIKNKGIILEFFTDSEETIMACDGDKIIRIMLNLLSNAVKFTRPGDSITINVRSRGESILISIKDTGIGIPEDKLDVIFERFRQLDRLLTRSHEGSGIGLSLVKSLVEMHGGNIYVESESGSGSEFIIMLPARVIPHDENSHEINKSDRQELIEKINIEFSDIY